MKMVIGRLEPDSAAVRTCQELIQSTDMNKNLAYLAAHYAFLVPKLNEIQGKGGSLSQSIKFLEEIQARVFSANQGVGTQIIKKLKDVIGKNPDLDKIMNANEILLGREPDEAVHLNPNTIAALKFAPLTMVEVERSFSMHKYLLSDKRQSITPENLEMEIVCHFEL